MIIFKTILSHICRAILLVNILSIFFIFIVWKIKGIPPTPLVILIWGIAFILQSHNTYRILTTKGEQNARIKN